MDFRLQFEKGKQRNFLLAFYKKQNLPQRELSKLLGISRWTLKDWLKEKCNMKLLVFQKICILQPELKEFENYIEKKLPMNWGSKKGALSRNATIGDMKKNMVYVRSFIKNRIKSRVGKKKSVKINNSLLLHLEKEGVDLMCILATCLMTDGSLSAKGNRNRIAFASKDQILKEFMKNLLLRLSKYMPTINESKKGVFILSLSDATLSKNLFKLSPNYKTSPAQNQTIDDYLSEPQPNLNFLNKCDEKTLIWCIRFAFTTDGCISYPKNEKPELNLACYNANLCKQWQSTFEKYGINGHIGKHKSSWSGASGVRVYNSESISNFWKLGGFIDGVKISKKSKRYCGVEKNELLRAIVKNGDGVIRTRDRTIISRELHQTKLRPPNGL